MSEATELLEKMEEAAGHGHGGHGGPGKMIGITMAILGVMLAFCAAMVGSQRTELIKTMVEQSSKWGLYQSESMKFRVMEADDEDTAELKETIDLATRELAEILTPDKEDEDRFASIRDRYKHDMVEAKE